SWKLEAGSWKLEAGSLIRVGPGTSQASGICGKTQRPQHLELLQASSFKPPAARLAALGVSRSRRL
ncbi:MAG: hypothetical protein VW877_12480, partial [Pseudomonadaceae bacterium]